MAFIEISDVVKQYKGHTALNHVNLSVPKGCIYGLLGPNGAGKTTLIRIINMITAPDSGTVMLDGSPITADDVAHIGYLPEERGLYKKMKVGDEIVYLARLKGMSKADATRQMLYWLDRFHLTEWRDKKVETLSKGMQQKVQFIATVIHEPKLLIFDEPFSGFDPVNAEQLKREILELQKRVPPFCFLPTIWRVWRRCVTKSPSSTTPRWCLKATWQRLSSALKSIFTKSASLAANSFSLARNCSLSRKRAPTAPLSFAWRKVWLSVR